MEITEILCTKCIVWKLEPQLCDVGEERETNKSRSIAEAHNLNEASMSAVCRKIGYKSF